MDGNWRRLEPVAPQGDEQGKVLLAQLSWLALLCLVMFLLLPSLFWSLPPGGLSIWGGVVGLIAIGLWGWRSVRLVIKLVRPRLNRLRLSRVLGPCVVRLLRPAALDQPLKLRIRQQTLIPVDLDRRDVTLVCVKGIVQASHEEANGIPLGRDREVWSSTKTSALEKPVLPAHSTIETLTEFSLPGVTELLAQADRQGYKTIGGEEGERASALPPHLEWRVRVQTYLADGRATEALFRLPGAAGDLDGV